MATYPQLLTTLANLAGSGMGWFSETDWPRLLTKVVADTEWMNDPEGGKMTAMQMVEANRIAYTKAGLRVESKKLLTESKPSREQLIAEAEKLEAEAEALLLKVGIEDA